MENICRNCDYFVQVSTSSTVYAFGDCMNPETLVVGEDGTKKGAFKWADGTCIDFKPRTNPYSSDGGTFGP